MTKQNPQLERSDPKTNRILAAMGDADYDALMLEAEIVPLKFRKRLHDQDERVDAVYFPLTCMVSLVVTNDGTPRMEMATVGNEGVAGGSVVLQMQPAMGLILIQIPGVAVRIKADALRRIISGYRSWRRPSICTCTRSCGRYSTERPVTGCIAWKSAAPAGC